MEKWFKFAERKTSLSTEILAGVTTFVTMAYIVVVNPAILSNAGMDFNAVFIATIVATMIGTLIMGIFANYPIAIAPGLGMAPYFAFGVVVAMGVSWEKALGAVFIASVLFIILSLTNLRNVLIDAIPASLKQGISAGIGLFITFIGLQHANLIVDSPSTLVAMGSLTDPVALLTIVGLLLTLALMVYQVKGAIFAGMVITALIAYFQGMMTVPDSFVMMPTGLENTLLKMDLAGVFDSGLYAVIFTFLIVTLFDTTGTMIGIGEQAGLIKNGKFPKIKSALLADSVASTIGAMTGTSPTSCFVESGTGVAAGGRTGFTAVVVAVLFALLLFFAPVAQMLASVPAITAPALIIVGFFMMDNLRKIDWSNLEEAFPAFLVLFLMPISYSIATGVGVGFIVYPLLKILRGKAAEVHPLMYVFQILFIIELGFLQH